MIKITTLRICIGISCAWPLLWLLVFDRWFFLSPLGLIIAFGIPIGGWVAGINYYRGREEMLLVHSRLLAQRNAEFFLNLKKRFAKN
jgi:hypothetical protein